MSPYLRRLKLAARPVSALFVACLFAVFAAMPASAVDITTPGSGTWTAPAGVTSITIECWGAGGGGGMDTNSNNGGGGGGGGGAYAKVNNFAVTPGTGYAYIVGNAGTGTGGDTSFNSSTCYADGGAAGGTGSAGGAGGGGAGGTVANSTGDIKLAGGAGAAGANNNGGGGGGSAGSAAGGNSGSSNGNPASAVTDGGPGGAGTSNGDGFAPISGPGGGGGGGEWSGTTRAGGTGFPGQIRITYKIATTTTISCGAGPFTFTGAAQTPCTATVTAPDGLNQSVTVNYSSNTNAGTASASASFVATANYLASSANTTFTIDKAATTTAVTCGAGPFTYTGSAQMPCSATVTGPGLSLTPAVSYSNNTNAGTAVASYSYAGAANYLTSSDNKSFTINKANPTLSVSNSPATYDGTAKTATVTSSTAGTASNIKYGGSGTAPTNAGTYAVTANFVPTDATNYNSLADVAAGNFVINKATPTVAVNNSPVIYSGAPQAATVVGSVAGTVSNILYGVSPTAPTNAGTYAVKADFAPTDATNYNSLSGAAAGSFIINKANPTLSVTNSPVTFDGTAKTATVVGSVAGAVTNVRYNGSTTVPINAATYAMTASFAPTDSTNYNSLTSATAGNFVINQAATTTTVTCTAGPFTYTGSAITPCSASVTGPGGLNLSGLTVSYSNNIGAGTASASATYAGAPNYLTSTDSKNFTIGKATPTLSISNSPATYDGAAKTATVVGSPGGTVSNIQYGGAPTAPTAAGTYAITTDFEPTDTANYISLTGAAAGNFIINKAATTTTVTCTAGPFTYTGAAQTPCSAAVTGAGGLSEAVGVTYAGNTNAGTATASATYAATANYLTSTDSKNFTIGKATPTLAVSNSPATFSGTAKTATIAATGPAGSVAGSASSIKYDNSAMQPINAGTYVVTANFTPSDTTNYNSLTGAGAGNFVIDKAATTTTVTCPAGPFTYTGSAITPACTAAATGPDGLNLTGLTVSLANNINAGTASASAAYAGAGNYLASNGSTTFTIGKATPTLAISNSPATFDGTAKAANIAANATAGTVSGTFDNVMYDTSATAPADAGSYAVTADFVPTDDANYNSVTAVAVGNFVINKALSTTAVTCTAGPFAYTGAAQAPCTATVTGLGGLNLALTVNYSNNTNAGTATAAASYAATANYLGSSDSTTFTIGKAATTTAVTCDPGPFVYTGSAQTPCAAGVTGPGGLSLVLTVSYASNTGAGTASAAASYGGTANYFGSTDSTTFTIAKADPVLAVTNSPQVYNGTAKTANIVATATAGTVNGVLSNVEYGLSAAAPSDAGTYAVTADFTPTDSNNYNTLSGAGAGSFTITKAASTTAVTCNAGPFPFTGAAITPCAASVTGMGGLNEVLTVVYADNVNAGTASADASFAGNPNYFGSTNGTTFTIAKAPSSTTVTCAAGPFTYTGSAQTPCAAAATGPGGLNLVLTVSYANNIGSGTANAGASYAGAANYLGSTDSTTFAIGKATPILAVSNSPQVYDGTAKAATVAAAFGASAGIVAGNASNIQYDGSSSEPSDAGSYAVTADFTPVDTANFNPVSGGSAGNFMIGPAATTTTVTCAAGPFVYNGLPHEPCAAIATGPNGLNQSVPVVYADNTNAGTAAAGASYAGSANYSPSSGSATFPIDKADPTLAVSNSPVTYDGTVKTAAVSGSVAGTVSGVKYDGSAAEPIGAGSYAVTADFVPDDAANYNAIGSAAAGSFVINKADPTLAVTNSPAAYDGTPKTANVVGSVPGTASNLTYNTVVGAPTNAGTYAVNADFVPDDAANYNSLTGAAAGNFVIQKAGTPTLAVSNSPVIFNGIPQAAVVVGSVAGTAANVRYNGAATVPTDAGSYVITADFVPDDTVNYDTITGAAAGTLVIEPAATSTAVTCAAGPFTYTGAAQTPCTATVSGPGGLSQALTVVYTGNVDAGTATADAAFGGDANYLPSSNSATFTINLADPTLSVTNSPSAYDGTPKTAAVSSSVPGTVSNIRYNGSANAPADAGTYAITADFVPDDAANYNTLSGANAGNFVIQKAGTPVLAVSNSPLVFTGVAQAAVVVGSVPGTVSNIRYDGSATEPSDAGSYVITADFVPDDTVNYDSITGVSAGSFTIARAATTTAIDCGVGTYTYTGSAQTPCTATVTGPGGLSEAVTVSYSSNTNVGVAAAGANYAGGANYLPSSAAGSFIIAKAPTTTTISCGVGPFAYTGAAIEPCAATVSGPGGLSHAVPVTYADNLEAGTASVSASFAGGINYLLSSGTATFTIAPAATTTVVTCSGGPFSYSGVAFTPCAAQVSGPNGWSEVRPVVYANNTGAGTASASAGYTGTANYAASSGTATFAIAKAPTVTVVICAAGPFTVTGSAIEPCTASVTGAGGLSQALAVSYSNNVNAGTATASASYAGDANHLGSSDTEVFVIGQTEAATVFLHLPYMSK